jgi:hypothetical protein
MAQRSPLLGTCAHGDVGRRSADAVANTRAAAENWLQRSDGSMARTTRDQSSCLVSVLAGNNRALGSMAKGGEIVTARMGSTRRESLSSQIKGPCDGAAASQTLSHGPREIMNNSRYPRSGVSDLARQVHPGTGSHTRPG